MHEISLPDGFIYPLLDFFWILLSFNNLTWIISSALIPDGRNEGNIKHKVKVVNSEERQRPNSWGSFERQNVRLCMRGFSQVTASWLCPNRSSIWRLAQCPLPHSFCLRPTSCTIPSVLNSFFSDKTSFRSLSPWSLPRLPDIILPLDIISGDFQAYCV